MLEDFTFEAPKFGEQKYNLNLNWRNKLQQFNSFLQSGTVEVTFVVSTLLSLDSLALGMHGKMTILNKRYWKSAFYQNGDCRIDFSIIGFMERK